jgi:putative protein-disulfide isomerase
MAGMDQLPAKRILYFADPMCSWCWGFSPVIADIARACGERVPIRLCVGGLRAGETRAMDDRAKAYVRHHWEQVETCTGEPFDYAFFERQEFVYDTEPACRAAVAARSLAPEATLGYLAAVQHAFYAENRDVTREEVLTDVAAALGLSRDDFVAVYRAPEVAEATRADFALAQALGIGGFPTVLLQNDKQLTVLSAGYQPFVGLEPQLRAWLGG